MLRGEAEKPMQRLEDYYRHKISQEGFDLFALFSRFEYAMKKGGFRRQTSPDAAWRTFAECLPADFFARMKAASEAKVYFQQPPDHLVVDGADDVRWSGQPDRPKDAASLFDSIKVARNNLFHGDKAHNNQHDTELMAAALYILNEAYRVAECDSKFNRFVSAMEYGL